MKLELKLSVSLKADPRPQEPEEPQKEGSTSQAEIAYGQPGPRLPEPIGFAPIETELSVRK